MYNMMPANFNLYSAWMDPYFYVWAAVFAAALFALIYSLRSFMALKDARPEEEEAAPAAEPEAQEQNPFLDEPAGEKTLVLAPGEQQAYLPPEPEEQAAPEAAAEVPAEVPAEEPRPEPAPEPAAPSSAAARADNNRAENFVRGIYEGISDLDERMKGIEAALSKSRVNNDFTVKFLEDVLQDIDNLDKTKIKARIEYLLADLKK
ncbi:MAG: hypothetical protein A2X30_00720 [Elusimicrobia bacterium GWB2_63_16]|nr:MAG: hypothetical protein A2X30_00720 [Elusimicrobia bacterium GWB2_63_16]